MHPRESDNSLIYAWLIFIQDHYGIYHVDNRHQCHKKKEYTSNLIVEREILEQKKKRLKLCGERGGYNYNNGGDDDDEEKETVIRPFIWAPNFYGCIQCGRYHFCRRRELDCEIIYTETDYQMTCIHSGKLLNDPTSYLIGNFNGEKKFDKEASSLQIETEINMTSGKSYKPYKIHNLYTNMNIRQPFNNDINIDTVTLKPEKTQRRKKYKKDYNKVDYVDHDNDGDFLSEQTHVQNKVQEEEEKEGTLIMTMDEEEGNDMIIDNVINETSIKYKNIHPNKIYWTEYYRFLLTPNLVSSDLNIQKVNEYNGSNSGNSDNDDKGGGVGGGGGEKQHESILNHINILEEVDGETVKLIDNALYEIISRTITIQCQQKKIQLINDKILQSLLLYYTPIVSRVIQLIQHLCKQHIQRFSIHNLCIAFLLEHLTKSYCLKDAYNCHIQIWRKDPWFSMLEEDGTIDNMYEKKQRQRNMINTKKKNLHLYDKKQINEASIIIRRVFSLCQSQPLWLRDFLLNGHSY